MAASRPGLSLLTAMPYCSPVGISSTTSRSEKDSAIMFWATGRSMTMAL